jgi:hypothetical protein
MPILRGRYSFTLLRWCSLIYDRVVVIWDPTVQDLARLLAEGRMMLAIPEVIWMTSPPTDLSSPDRWNYIRASDDDREPPEGITCLEVRPDMGEAPAPGSLVLPYTVHPRNFDRSPSASAPGERPIRVFFSGVASFYKDRDLVSRLFGMPCRDDSIAALRKSDLPIHFIDSCNDRARLGREIESGETFPVLVATCRGDMDHWYRELEMASFFLCLPGSHMLMCHNAIEAMACGCIPILAYSNWFQPHLTDGQNALTYGDLESMIRAIRRALSMEPAEVAIMHHAVCDYYRDHLEPRKVAAMARKQVERGELKRLYLNHEDCLTLSRAGQGSALTAGRTVW